jgi:hypothetical protein
LVKPVDADVLLATVQRVLLRRGGEHRAAAL